MDSLLAATPPVPPHYHEHTRLSPTRSMSTLSSSRKRKASPSPGPDDDPMSTSPALSSARLPTTTPRSIKRSRSNLTGKPLTVPRLLETLDKDALRGVLSSLFHRHPELKEEILHLSPRPSIPSTLQVLRQYQSTLNSSFPLSENPRSDYSYNRVRGPLTSLLDALNDFTPHFLPPNQSQSSTSLTYLDGVTQIIHDLPRWDSVQHNLIKENAYDEIAGAWICVIREASKRGGGIQLQHGDWENKLRRHNELSGGRLHEAIEELRNSLGWMGSGYGSMESHHAYTGQGQQLIRQQLISGTYGSEFPAMRTGAW